MPATQTIEDKGTPMHLISGDIRPVPDPTALTTAQLKEAIIAVERLIEAKLQAMATAVQLQATRFDELATASTDNSGKIGVHEERFDSMHHSIEHLAHLTDERFAGLKALVIENFTNFKTLVEETNKLNKTALDAAFAASKEVVATQQTFNDKANTKSEASFTSQIGEVTKRLDLVGQNLADKIEAGNNNIQKMDGRVTTIESRGIGAVEQKSSGNVTIGQILAVISILVSIMAIMAVIGIALFLHH